MIPIFWVVVKASAMLGVAVLVQLVLRRRASAAARHFIWTSAAACLLVFPLAVLVLPAWNVAVPMAPSTVAVPIAAVGPTPPAALTDVGIASEELAPATPRSAAVSAGHPLAGVSWPMVLLVVYIAGVLWLSIRLIGQHRAIRRFARRSGEADTDWMRLLSDCAASLGVARPVGLLRSRELVVPSVFGIRRPTIVIPAIADTWQDDRRRAAIVHELAHVARLDCFTQALAGAACAM